MLFHSESLTIELIKHLNYKQISPRRYFYPTLNKLKYVKNFRCIISEDISNRILCLPLYFSLTEDSVSFISKEIKLFINS
jgi:dTDP-4-amino-4,6-dideoxygalactose transaminase